jgi:hypothetical protein
VRVDDGFHEIGETRNADGSVFRARGSLLLWLGITLFFIAVGVWFVVISIDYTPGLVFCLIWLGGVIWSAGFAFAYDVILMPNGDIYFRSLCRRRMVNAASVMKVKRSYSEGASWLAIRYVGGRVRIDDGEQEVELVRRLTRLNPAIQVDRRVLDD